MDENTTPSIWNKKQSDLTMKDIMKVNAAAVGAVVAVVVVLNVGVAAADKFKELKANRRNKKAQEIEK